jgi:hypothetical protein
MSQRWYTLVGVLYVFGTQFPTSNARNAEVGLRRAHSATAVLFNSDYNNIDVKDVVAALAGDPRLIFCEDEELIDIPVVKLAAAYGLTPSISEHLFMWLTRS